MVHLSEDWVGVTCGDSPSSSPRSVCLKYVECIWFSMLKEFCMALTTKSYIMANEGKYYIAYYTLSWRKLGERYLTSREDAKKYLEYVLYSDFLEYATDDFLEDVLQKADESQNMHKFIYRNHYFLIKRIPDENPSVS